MARKTLISTLLRRASTNNKTKATTKSPSKSFFNHFITPVKNSTLTTAATKTTTNNKNTNNNHTNNNSNNNTNNHGDVSSFKKLTRAKEFKGAKNPVDVVDAMFSLSQVLSPDVVKKLAAYFEEVLGDMLSILVEDTNSRTTINGIENKKGENLGYRRRSESWKYSKNNYNNSIYRDTILVDERLQHGRSWTVMMFLTQGPQNIRDKVLKKQYVNILVSALKNDVESMVIEHIGRVFIKLMADNQKSMCQLLSTSPGFIQRVVYHINVLAMSELLPRLISRQGFATRNLYTFTKPSKKGIAMLGQADVQKLLAQKFVDIVRAMPYDHASSMTIDNIVHAMIGICVRAMMIKRRETDPEDEDDGKYVSHLGIVTLSTLNAALDKIDLLVSPKPLIIVLDCALESANESLILSALSLAKGILETVADAREASDPTRQEIAREIDTGKIEDILVDRLEVLLKLIGPINHKESKTLGRVRLAAVELITSLLKVDISAKHVPAIEQSNILSRLLQMFVKYERSSILHESVTSAVVGSFMYSLREKKPMARAWIESGHIISVLLDLWERCSDPKIQSIYQRRLVEMLSTIRDRLVLDPELKDRVAHLGVLAKFDQFCQGPLRELVRRKERPLGGRNPSRMDTQIDIAEELETSEDLGQRIYTTSQLEDAASKSRATSDSTEVGVIAHVKGQTKSHISSGFSRWRKSLT